MKTLNFNEMEMIEGGLLDGKDVALCIADAYTNHGWSSVALGLMTALQPEGAFFVAAACIGKNA
jgi:hypothetical protein